jgi:phage shock protein PspC (stress-responsive transcriptional regulator)
VSGGLAEYFDMDVSLVRVGRPVLTCVTLGFAALAYGSLAVIMFRSRDVLDPNSLADHTTE